MVTITDKVQSEPRLRERALREQKLLGPLPSDTPVCVPTLRELRRVRSQMVLDPTRGKGKRRAKAKDAKARQSKKKLPRGLSPRIKQTLLALPEGARRAIVATQGLDPSELGL